MNLNLQEKKIIAKNWFETLRNSICREFESIEYLKSKKKIFFKKKKWIAGGSSKGGGTFALIENGSVFEKVGVNISTISGKFDKEFSKKIPGALNHNFWATGISVVAISIIKIIIYSTKKIAMNIFIYLIDKNLEEMAEYFMIILIPIAGIKILIIPEMLE